MATDGISLAPPKKNFFSSCIMASIAIQAALFAALLFIIISSQPMYKITNTVTSKVINLRLADAAGNATRVGLIVHALVFFGIMYAYARMNRI